MQTAVDDWLEKKGVYLEEPQMSLKIFAAKVGIPYKTLKPYVCQDVSKRKQVGSGVGGSGKSLVNEDTSQFMSDVLRRRDRANDGKDRTYTGRVKSHVSNSSYMHLACPCM